MMIDGRFGGGFWLATIISWVIWIAIVVGFIVLLAVAIRWLVRGERSGGSAVPPPPRPDDPLEILRQRYARGEIEEEEYERRRKTLSGG